MKFTRGAMIYGMVFLFLFAPYLKIGSFTIHLPYYFSFALFFLFVYLFVSRGIDKRFLSFFLVFLCGFVWILIVSLIHQTFDANMYLVYINGFTSICTAYAIAWLAVRHREQEGAAVFVICSVYYAGLVHALIMIAAFFVPPFRAFIYSFVMLGDKGMQFVEHLIRSPGLTTGGGDALSTMQAISLVFGVYLFLVVRSRIGVLTQLLYVASFFILLLSILLSARTGLVVLLLGGGLILFRNSAFFIIKQRFRTSSTKKYLTIIALATVLVPAGYTYIMESDYSRVAQRAFELYINYTEHGKLETSSTEHLKSMYFLPSDEAHLLFGNGNFGRDANLTYIDSDVGYVRTIFGSGIIGTLLIFAPLIYIVLSSIRLKNNSSDFMIIFLVLTILVINVKVFHYAGFRESFKVLVLLFASSKIAQSGNFSGYSKSTHIVN